MNNLKYVFSVAGILAAMTAFGQEPEKMRPGMTEFYKPVPPVVTPGQTIKGGGFTAPSDAIVLFDGKDLSMWENTNGGPAEWVVKDGIITVDKKKGDIRTKDEFNDFQLHIEWRVPKGISGSGQACGNSGVYLQGMYELQVLNSYENDTYVNGQAGSVYKQSAPLVNATREPGEWNVYDIIYKAPVFKADGSYRDRPRVTVFHNGVLIQNDTEILGTTEYIGVPRVVKHGAGPILLQSHGDPSEPISYRNIWIREL